MTTADLLQNLRAAGDPLDRLRPALRFLSEVQEEALDNEHLDPRLAHQLCLQLTRACYDYLEDLEAELLRDPLALDSEGGEL